MVSIETMKKPQDPKKLDRSQKLTEQTFTHLNSNKYCTFKILKILTKILQLRNKTFSSLKSHQNFLSHNHYEHQCVKMFN